jgi:hypothetical protein
LAIEFEWAQNNLDKSKAALLRAKEKAKQRTEESKSKAKKN